MVKFKIGDLVKIKNRDAVILNTKNLGTFTDSELNSFIHEGGLDDLFNHCGEKSEIIEIKGRDIKLKCSGFDWLEEDLILLYSNGQLEFDFDKK